VRAWVLLLAAVLLAPVAQASCRQDPVVIDANGDGRVDVGDVHQSPAEVAGTVVNGSDPLANSPLQPLPGTLSFLDLDGNGQVGPRDVALWDVPSSASRINDVLLGALPDGNASWPFGTVVRASMRLPAAGVGAYPGTPAVRWLDDDGDGVREAGEPLYGSQGSTVTPGDVRLASSAWPVGSIVRGSDQDSGRALHGGPVMAFFDADNTGKFSVQPCPTPTVSPTGTATSSASSSSSAPSSSATPASATPASSTASKGSSAAPWTVLGLAVLAAAGVRWKR
jgi:hypothetical protein